MEDSNAKKKEEDLVAKMIYGGQLPPKIYKYRSLSESSKKYTLDIFRKCELYFSAPKNFNDPFDCKIKSVIYSPDKFAKQIARRHNLPYSEKDVINAISSETSLQKEMDMAIEIVMNRYGICCFSKKNDEILMWSHYADCHAGICLEFDVEKDLNFFIYPINVEYLADYPKVDVSEDICKYVKTMLKAKYNKWSYENEVRVYKKKEKAFKFNPKALVAVYFGCQTTDEQIREVYKTVRENKELSHVVFYKGKKDDSSYKINFDAFRVESGRNM